MFLSGMLAHSNGIAPLNACRLSGSWSESSLSSGLLEEQRVRLRPWPADTFRAETSFVESRWDPATYSRPWPKPLGLEVLQLPAPPKYPLRHPKYHPMGTIRLLIEVHWGV